MKRKVNRVGQNTLTVSLPSKIVSKYGIKAGQELEMEEKSGDIVISFEKKTSSAKMKVTIENPEKFTARSIHIPYRMGCDELEINYSDPKVIPLIKNALSETIGFEIVDQGVKYCIIKNIASGLDQEFDQMFNRFFMIVKTMGNNLLDAVKKNNLDLLEETIILEGTAQKFVNFCCRELYIKGYKDGAKTVHIYGVVRGLERIADNFKMQAQALKGSIRLKRASEKMVKVSDGKEISLDKEFLQTITQLLELLQTVYEMMHKFEHDKLLEFRSREMEVKDQILKTIIKTKNGKENLIAAYNLSTVDELTHITELLF